MSTKKTVAATAATLKSKSESLINAFKVIITNLKATNEEAAAAKAANEVQIAALQDENEQITTLTNQNLKIIENIENLLGVSYIPIAEDNSRKAEEHLEINS